MSLPPFIARLLATLVLAIASSSAWAWVYQPLGIYAGFKQGMVFNDTDSLDDGAASGVVLGKSWSLLALEYEQLEADNDLVVAGKRLANVDVSTRALYVVARSPGPYYLKGRIGYLEERFDVESITTRAVDGIVDDAGVSVGGGLGVLGAYTRFETEFTLLESRMTCISASLSVTF